MAKEKSQGLAKERIVKFKAEGVKAIGCLKKNMECTKTKHLAFNRTKKTVQCMFDGKTCISPFSGAIDSNGNLIRKDGKSKSSKMAPEKTKKKSKEVKKAQKENAIKPVRKKAKAKKKRAKFTQMEFGTDRKRKEKAKETGVKVAEKGKKKKSKKSKPAKGLGL